jgi:hypothetical protein
MKTSARTTQSTATLIEIEYLKRECIALLGTCGFDEVTIHNIMIINSGCSGRALSVRLNGRLRKIRWIKNTYDDHKLNWAKFDQLYEQAIARNLITEKKARYFRKQLKAQTKKGMDLWESNGYSNNELTRLIACFETGISNNKPICICNLDSCRCNPYSDTYVAVVQTTSVVSSDV